MSVELNQYLCIDKNLKIAINYNSGDRYTYVPILRRRYYEICLNKIETQKKKLIFFSDFVKDDNFMRQLKEEKFDVGLAECIDPLAFAAFHRLGISTTVVTTSFGLISILIKFFGLPHPIGHPGFNQNSWLDSKWSQFQRL